MYQSYKPGRASVRVVGGMTIMEGLALGWLAGMARELHSEWGRKEGKSAVARVNGALSQAKSLDGVKRA